MPRQRSSGVRPRIVPDLAGRIETVEHDARLRRREQIAVGVALLGVGNTGQLSLSSGTPSPSLSLLVCARPNT
jgi:hypothetical protein